MAHRTQQRGSERDRESKRRKEEDETYGRREHGQKLNNYFLSGEGINREVLQAEICRYLGAEAHCRPGEQNGKKGFIINAIRPFTPLMEEDLRTASMQFEAERAQTKSRGHREGVSYQDSETRVSHLNTDYPAHGEPPQSRYGEPSRGAYYGDPRGGGHHGARSPYGQDSSYGSGRGAPYQDPNFAPQGYGAPQGYISSPGFGVGPPASGLPQGYTMAPNAPPMSAPSDARYRGEPNYPPQSYPGYSHGQAPQPPSRGYQDPYPPQGSGIPQGFSQQGSGIPQGGFPPQDPYGYPTPGSRDSAERYPDSMEGLSSPSAYPGTAPFQQGHTQYPPQSSGGSRPSGHSTTGGRRSGR